MSCSALPAKLLQGHSQGWHREVLQAPPAAQDLEMLASAVTVLRLSES